MRIVYHLGAHCTDEERLIRCLLKNRALLADQGIVVPAPTRYRKLLRDTAMTLRGAAASTETQAIVLEQIMDEPEAHRLVLSWDSFLSFPAWALSNGFYTAAGERIAGFTQIFPEIALEFHMAIRNPVTFLPALRDRMSGKGQTDVLTGVDPQSVRWSNVVQQILDRVPGAEITVWCDEDTPLIWPEVLEAVSGHAPGTVLEDMDELLGIIMTADGLSRMKAYCVAHPPASITQRRRIVTAFLEKFARPDQMEVDVALPGWTEDLVTRVTDLYHQDVARIGAMPGVRLLAP